MKTSIRTNALLAALATLAVAAAPAAQAQIRITEVAPWSSGNSPIAADWFELTNTGSSAVSLTGWKMDDDSAAFSSAVAMSGIGSIAAGESVIFIETSSAATITSFVSTWFNGNKPAGLQIGMYSGSGVGLGAGGDQVNVFDVSGVLQAAIKFGTSDSTLPFQTFDNAQGVNGTGTTISLFSVTGTNGAFVALGDSTEIGSPGTIATVVPEPTSYALMLGGLVLIGALGRRARNAKN